MLSGPDGFMLFGKPGVDFFATTEMLYPYMKVRLRIIGARPVFYMISDNPNISLGIIRFTLVVLLSKTIITTKQWICLHMLSLSTII